MALENKSPKHNAKLSHLCFGFFGRPVFRKKMRYYPILHFIIAAKASQGFWQNICRIIPNGREERECGKMGKKIDDSQNDPKKDQKKSSI